MDIQITRKNDLTTFIITGQLDAEEITSAIEEFYGENPTRLVLWDIRGADFSRIWNPEIKSLAETSTRLEGRRLHGRTALVFDADVGFGIGRMFNAFRESDDPLVQYESFRSSDDALEWLLAD